MKSCKANRIDASITLVWRLSNLCIKKLLVGVHSFAKSPTECEKHNACDEVYVRTLFGHRKRNKNPGLHTELHQATKDF